MDRILPLFRFAEVKAESVKETAETQRTKSSRLWPRLLSFNSSSQDCDDEEEEEEEECEPDSVSSPQESDIYCEDDDEETDNQGKGGGDGAPGNAQCNDFSKRFGCMYSGARFGLREGALSGLFFGGGFGMYKYFDNVYVKGGQDEGESSDDSGESTRNENIIFVTAANGAIAMAVFCTLFCSAKAAIYCT